MHVTKELKDKIAAEYAAGEPTAAIARRHNVSVSYPSTIGIARGLAETRRENMLLMRAVRAARMRPPPQYVAFQRSPSIIEDGRMSFTMELDTETLLAVRRAAGSRHTTPVDLMARAIKVMAADDIWAAVLDDGGGG